MENEIKELKKTIYRLDKKIKEVFIESSGIEEEQERLDVLYYRIALAQERLDKIKEKKARQELESNSRTLPKHDHLDNLILSDEDMDDLDDYYDYYDNACIDEEL